MIGVKIGRRKGRSKITGENRILYILLGVGIVVLLLV